MGERVDRDPESLKIISNFTEVAVRYSPRLWWMRRSTDLYISVLNLLWLRLKTLIDRPQRLCQLALDQDGMTIAYRCIAPRRIG